MKKLIFSLFILMTGNFQLYPLGTYSEGWMIGKIIQFESRGLLFESYEGILEYKLYDQSEKCDEDKDECFAPISKQIPFSVRPESTEAVNLLTGSINKELLLGFRIHRVEALALSSDFEVTAALEQRSDPGQMEERMIVSKTGSKRNFSVAGKILKLEYSGTVVGTYEGLYLDESRGKIHPFSITDEKMAKYAWDAMKLNQKFFMGISVAYAKGFRESNYDLFEINLKAPAGGVYK